MKRHITAQPVPAGVIPSGPAWVTQLKLDGYRMLASKRAGRVRVISRTGTDYTRRLDRIVAALQALPIDDVVLDGEAVVTVDGRMDFLALQTTRGAASAELACFDLLHAHGQDVADQVLRERLVILETVLDQAPDGLSIVPALEGQPHDIWRAIVEHDLEGVVSKRLDARYRAGPCKAWLKVKNRAYSRYDGDRS